MAPRRRLLLLMAVASAASSVGRAAQPPPRATPAAVRRTVDDDDLLRRRNPPHLIQSAVLADAAGPRTMTYDVPADDTDVPSSVADDGGYLEAVIPLLVLCLFACGVIIVACVDGCRGRSGDEAYSGDAVLKKRRFVDLAWAGTVKAASGGNAPAGRARTARPGFSAASAA